MKFIVLSVFLIFASSTDSLAARRDNRQDRQQGRIHQGVKSGELTKREARKLRAEQKNIRRAERRAESDGNVTNKEKAKIERMQDRASENIYQQKHDSQDRGGATAPASGGSPASDSGALE
jgi:hypothetical protein